MRNNEIIVPGSQKEKEDIIPISFIETVQSLKLDDLTINYDAKNEIGTISGKKDGHNYTVIAEKNPIGETVTHTRYLELERKSDYKDEVKMLYSKGLKQKDIALRLGISQSMVSKLLNDK